jgi:hypothetical protein
VSTEPEFDNPPEAAPEGADPLIWRLAYGLFRDHQPGGGGECASCHRQAPCEWRLLAQAGFQKALRWPDGGPARNIGRY